MLVAAEEADQRRDQQGPREQGVEQEADGHREGELAEGLDRDQRDGGEGEGEDQARRR